MSNAIKILVCVLVLGAMVSVCRSDETKKADKAPAGGAAAVTADKAGDAAAKTEAEPEAADGEAAKQTEEKITLKKAAPLDGLQWVQGKPVKFEAGKVYVVEFWATWCGPCRQSIPHLTALQKEYKNKGVTVIGIANEDADTVKKFMKQPKIDMGYTVATDTKGLMNRAYMEAYGQSGIPAAFIIDQKGFVVWYGHPLTDMEEVLKLVAAGEFDAVQYRKDMLAAEKLRKKLSKLFEDYFGAVMQGEPYMKHRKTLDEIAATAPPQAMNEVAWVILTQVPADNRDLERALKIAKQVNATTKGKEPAVLDTYALALYENGLVEEAIKTQTKAIELADGQDPEFVESLKRNLERYKKQK